MNRKVGKQGIAKKLWNKGAQDPLLLPANILVDV